METIIFNKIAVNNKVIIDLPAMFEGFLLEIQVKPVNFNPFANSKKSLRGALSQFADLNKIELESTAWVNSVG
jgi:hypothetical protein